MRFSFGLRVCFEAGCTGELCAAVTTKSAIASCPIWNGPGSAVKNLLGPPGGLLFAHLHFNYKPKKHNPEKLPWTPAHGEQTLDDKL